MCLFRQALTFGVAVALLCGSVSIAAVAGTVLVPSAQRQASLPAANARIGIDVDDVQTSSSVIFTDVMKQASAWVSDRPLAVGEDGYVRRLAPKQIAQTVTLQSAAYPAGDYTLLWDGSGTLEIDGRSGSLTRTSANSAIAHVAPASGYGIRLRLSATNPRNYLRNLRLILPGFAASYQTQVFAPAVVARLSAFNVVRFAHWSQADALTASASWPMRPAVARFTQSGPAGVALEYQIALANAVGADPWFVIPVGATNFYITQTAALVRARLDPRLRPSFEYAPGAWRPGSPTNAYAAMAGRNFKLAPDAPGAAVAWYAQRSTQMFAIVRAVFGADAARITRVLGGALAAPNTPADAFDRTILANAGGAQRADVFAVDATLPLPAAIAHTQAMAAAAGLTLVAAQSEFAGLQQLRGTLATWHALGANLFVGSAVPASALAAQIAAFASYQRTYPTGHLTPLAQTAVDPAPEAFATSYIPSAAAGPAIASEAAATHAHALAVRAASSTLGIDINSGGIASGSWVADVDFVGGSVSGGTGRTIDVTGVTNPAPQTVYQHARYGSSFSYVIPGLTPAGTYTVRLHFVEFVESAAGKRYGNWSINGTPVLTNFDIFAAAGAKYKAVAEQFTATASSTGTITIAATGSPTAFDKSAIIGGIEIIAAGGGGGSTPADVLQYHNDTLRTGWNPTETALTTATVASTKFGLRQTWNVDGLVLAQPLYVAGYPVSADGGKTHNVVIVATENDTVYAFDADSGAVLWQHNLGPAQSSNDIACSDVMPSFGISSTPAIDRSSGTLYVVAATEPTSKVYATQLHALDLGSGADKIPAVSITASAVMSNGTNILYNSANNMQRASVLLANNSLYLGAGSHCDHNNHTVSGWLLRYSASTLQQQAAFNTVEDSGQSELASIWGAGFGPAADTQGNIYTVTGNGAFDASSSGHNYAMSVLRFAPDLSGGVLDWFAYSTENSDNNIDNDFGSGGVMLLPTQSAGVPNTLVAMGKSSKIYLLNQANLGHFTSLDSGALSIASPGPGGVWGGPAFYQGPSGPIVYYQIGYGPMLAYNVIENGTTSTLSLSSTGTIHSGYGGSIPVVSSNGPTAGSAVVWTLRRNYLGGTSNSTLTLDAYDASNVANHLFAAAAGTWSQVSDSGFVTPLVANGKVYAGAYQTVTVYGLGP